MLYTCLKNAFIDKKPRKHVFGIVQACPKIVENDKKLRKNVYGIVQACKKKSKSIRNPDNKYLQLFSVLYTCNKNEEIRKKPRTKVFGIVQACKKNDEIDKKTGKLELAIVQRVVHLVQNNAEIDKKPREKLIGIVQFVVDLTKKRWTRQLESCRCGKYVEKPLNNVIGTVQSFVDL